jgi:hypothetical protein
MVESAPRSRWRKRSRILLGIAIALLVVRALQGVDFTHPSTAVDKPVLIDRCVTDQAVLDFLDGKTISTSVTDAHGKHLETIALRKDRISSLSIRSKNVWLIGLRFNLDHEATTYIVDASFALANIDSPELHYHGWQHFTGYAVPNR